MNDEIDEVVAEFLVESHENLDQLDHDFIALEEQPHDRALLASVFRTIHTIKGTCGFLGFGRLEGLAHAGEHLLSRLRDGSLTLDAARTSALLAMVDAVRTMLGEIESSGTDGTDDHVALIAELDRVARPDTADPDGSAETAGDDPALDEPAGDDPAGVDPAVEEPVGDELTDLDAPPKLGEILVETGAVSAGEVSLALHAQDLGDDRKVGEIIVSLGATDESHIAEALDRQDAERGVDGDAKSSIADSTIRVEVARLDRLMNLVGELVLSRNNIVQAVSGNADRSLVTAAQRLDIITSELQENLMKTRMQPVGSAWSKMPRIVREVANSCGKQVRLEMIGEETELDKTVIDAIRDPLTHLVRNAIDHGIETAIVRTAQGKHGEGRLSLRASHESGQVVIEIVDDGAGIDPERVKAKALANGIITLDESARMTEREAIGLIFLPGFSTADQVTSVSGRGVGMDVVKTKIEQIGGTVDVTTRLGEGTTFTVKIPLTLAIVPALLVRCGAERFAVPEINVVELVHLKGDATGPGAPASGVELLHNAPVYRLRGRLLPIVDLGAVLGIGGERSERPTLAVLQADDRQFGLLVDEVVDTQEIVVKPLSRLLSSVAVYAGATIMGDGLVALILDVLRLGQHAEVLSEAAGGSRFDRSGHHGAAPGDDDAAETSTILLVAAGDRRAALRLDQIARLEQISTDAIEWRGYQQVVQYRGEIMPLVQLGDVMATGGGSTSSDELTIVVCGHGPHVGLLVDTIVDICATPNAALAAADQGTVVLQDRVTELVDVGRVLAAGGVERRGDGDDTTASELEGSLI